MAKEPSGPSPKKKGGAVYPRIGLNDAIGFARKLVSKTHSAPQPYTTIFPGVFGVKPTNTQGQVRASALKQYGLLEGKPDAYTATQLARKIASAPAEELPGLNEQACLKPKVFRVLFDTFHDDTVSLAKLKQQAASSGVHPDQAEDCAKLFMESAVFSQVAVSDGDSIKIAPVTKAAKTEGISQDENEETESTAPSDVTTENGEIDIHVVEANDEQYGAPKSRSARSVVHVNVTIDSSLDTEKLEKQLALLRKYGAL